MTTIDDIRDSGGGSARAAHSWWPKWSKLRSALYETAAIGALTFVGGGVVSAALEEPVNTTVIPFVLNAFGHEQRIDVFRQSGDGTLELDSCYKLLVPLSSGSVSGRMVEILDKNICSAPMPEAKDGEILKPLQFKTAGAMNGSLLNVAFVPINSSERSGGSFSADANNTPGYYVGSMQVLAHYSAGTCALWHYWVVIGGPEQEPMFKQTLAKRLADKTNPMHALLPETLATGGCEKNKASPTATPANATN